MTQVSEPVQGELSREPKRYGIIEIGTRGIRLLVADASSAGIQTIIYSAGELSHLGEAVEAEGAIPPTTMKHIQSIITSYLEIAKQNGAQDLSAIATESVRAASNRDQFEGEISRIIPLEVLSKDREVTFAFLASFEAFERELVEGSNVLIVDQGGGTTELIYGYVRDDGLPAIKAAQTLDFGTIALSKMFVSSPSASVAWERISERLRQGLEDGDHATRFADLLSRPPDLAIALGGAITLYARDEIGSAEGRKPTLRSLHGRRVDANEIVRYLGRIQPALEQMKLTPADFTPDSDEAVVLSGLVVYAGIAQKHAIRQYRISRSGMRYGALSWHAGKRVLVEL